MRHPNDDREYFFDKPKKVDALLLIFFVSCVLSFLADYFVPKDHLHFHWEESFGFYAVFGFVACVVLVLISKYVLRPLVMKDEDFYD